MQVLRAYIAPGVLPMLLGVSEIYIFRYLEKIAVVLYLAGTGISSDGWELELSLSSTVKQFPYEVSLNEDGYYSKNVVLICCTGSSQGLDLGFTIREHQENEMTSFI